MNTPDTAPHGTPAEVFRAFLKLGLTSFGGPIAHLGYFRTELVERRRWLDDHAYSDLVALCQFLPGPASSQVGMALGLGRAGFRGLLAAWAGFTLPSALVLILFAQGITHDPDLARSGWVHGLKIVAVAVVAQAVWGMARTLCPDRPRAGLIALALFALLLGGLPLWAAASNSTVATLVEGVYRSGALVFGGGHVVLPLLQATVVPDGAVSNADFLAGYGAAQAVPGPLFTFAAFLGAVADWPLHGWIGGLVLLVAVFLPGFLVLIGTLPFWDTLRQRTSIRSTLAGINAGVVGILLSALYDPVWTSAIHGRADFGLALACFGLLVIGRLPPVAVVLIAAVAGGLLGAGTP